MTSVPPALRAEAASTDALSYRLIIVLAFVVGVALAKLVVVFHARRGTRAERTIYVLEAVCLCGLMIVGLIALPLRTADALATLACGLLGAMAMGVQTAHGQLVLHGHAPTTLMTQNLVRAVIDAIDALSTQSVAVRNESTTRFWDSVLPVCGFAVGALVGAISWSHASFLALLFPVVLLSILALRAGTGPCAVGE